jgi:hypothetical protein
MQRKRGSTVGSAKAGLDTAASPAANIPRRVTQPRHIAATHRGAGGRYEGTP